MKVPATRPGDFLAEMFKTDEQMLKVRARIVDEQKRISTVEERKRNQANAKFGKAVGVKRMEEKAKKKKQTLQELEKWKYTTYFISYKRRERDHPPGGGSI